MPAATKLKKGKASTDNIIITAALPYSNGHIHIGHLLEYIQADIFARFLKLIGKNTLYICASDMHGTPIEVNAKKAGKEPEQFANEFWKEHQEDFKLFHIQFDNYYKTHSKENKELSEFFFRELKKKGLIYLKKINCIYCPSCVRYLPDRYVKGICPNCTAANQYGDVCESCNIVLKAVDLIDPKCSLCGKTPKQQESAHYFFKLSSFAKQLKEWINNKESDLQQEVKNWLKEWLDKGLEDWCISRDEPYFGFEIPDSKQEAGSTKYFYVWLDAPIGYISSTKNYCDKHKSTWEEYWHHGSVHHFIGKDIAYFHFFFWPAMLMAVGIPLPKLTVHGFITVNGQKMSKSRGTFFTAKDFHKLYPAEALRFFYAAHLDRKVVDVDLNFDEFKALNNNVLVGSLGNFCYRVLTFAEKNYGGVKEILSNKELTAKIEALFALVKEAYAVQDYKAATKLILQIADIGNATFQNAEPWKEKDAPHTKATVGWCVNLARNLSIIVQPILPDFSVKIQESLGEKKVSWNDIHFSWKGKVKPPKLLVQKIEKVEAPTITEEVKSVTYVVSPQVEQLGIKVRIAQLSGLTIKKKHEGIERLKSEIQKQVIKFENKLVLEEYNALNAKGGVDSKKHPNSVINLIHLIKEKGKLPSINTVVDVYNAISVESNISMATHDLSKLEGKIDIRLSGKGELFLSLDGTKEILHDGEVVYADDHKVIGRFSRQCKQTLTTTDSRHIALVAFANAKVSDVALDKAVEKACQLIVKFNGGTYKILPNTQLSQFPLHLKIGEIAEVKDHPNADSLYLLTVRFSPTETRQVVAGIKKYLSPKILRGRKAVFCTNMKPAKIRGELSQAMILVADDEENVALLEQEKAKVGDEVHVQGVESTAKEVTFDQFTTLILTVSKGNVWYDGKKLVTKSGDITVHGVKEGAPIR